MNVRPWAVRGEIHLAPCWRLEGGVAIVCRVKAPTGEASMLDRVAQLLGVSTGVAAILLGVIVLQVATQVYAIVDLVRRSSVRGGRKWPWALAVAFGNLPGAIAYLAAGRTPPAVDTSSAGSGASTAGADASRRAVDSLYGRRD
jgi:hypothetical protein